MLLRNVIPVHLLTAQNELSVEGGGVEGPFWSVTFFLSSLIGTVLTEHEKKASNIFSASFKIIVF